MANHLIIGLGGTGGAVLRELRKRIYEEYRSNDPAEKIFLDYLYVDSDQSAIDDVANWKSLGHSVSLDDGQWLGINGLPSAIITDLYKYPHIHSFFSDEDKKDLTEDISNIIGAGIGGQRRRFGRMLLANNMGGEASMSFLSFVRSGVDRLLEKAKKGGGDTGNVTFHICAGLAGGTGSGTIVDAVAQIRNLYKQNGKDKQYRICLYLYIPEERIKNPDCDKEPHLYRPNGYAALLELNAMMLPDKFKYCPIDISNKSGEVIRLLKEENAFSYAYLYTNRTDGGTNEFNLSELPSMVADFLFQKIIIGISSRFEINENAGSLPEKDAAGEFVHARNFLTFGIKRLIYPETEITEYTSYRFAHVTALQMLYGWPKNGFPRELSDEDVNISKGDVINTKFDDNFKARHTLKMTDARFMIDSEYFTLYSDRSKSWIGINDFWNKKAQVFFKLIKDKKDTNDWCKVMAYELSSQFNKDFRGQGVRGFYELCQDDIPNLSHEVVHHVGETLFAKWKNGDYSLAELKKYLTFLIEDCRARYAHYDDSIALEQQRIVKLMQASKEIEAKWANRSFLGDVFKISDKTFEQYTNRQRDFYITKTRKEALIFAKELINQVISDLSSLLDDVTSFFKRMQDYAQMIQEHAFEKCKEDGFSFDKEVVKLYDPKLVQQLVDGFVHDEKKRTDEAQIVRELILGEDDFEKIFKRFKNKEDIDKVLNTRYWDNATACMQNFAASNKQQKLIGVNILEKLSQEPDWEKVIDNLCNSAQVLLEFEDKQIAMGGNSEIGKTIQLCLPQYEENNDFRDAVIDRIKAYCRGKGYQFAEDGSLQGIIEGKVTQLVLLTGKSTFPLRFIHNVNVLKPLYDKCCENIAYRKVIHTESFATPLPSLLNKTKEELRAELYPVLLLAYGMPGIVTEKEDSETGAHYNGIGYLTQNNGKRSGVNVNGKIRAEGFINVGNNILDSLAKLEIDNPSAYMLSELVYGELAANYRHNAKKAELSKAINELLDNVLLPLCGGNDTDMTYRKFVNAANNLFNNQLKEM